MADAEESVSRPAGPSAAPISFSFSRRAARRRLADQGDDPGGPPEEKDFLKSVEGRKLQSVNPSEAPKELVIPLIQNDPRRQLPVQAPGPNTDIEAIGDGMLSQAVKELIEESKKSLEERENAGVDPTLAIPMIQKRCTPNEEGAGSEPRAETVSWPLHPSCPSLSFPYLPGLPSCTEQGKSVCVLEACCLSLSPTIPCSV